MGMAKQHYLLAIRGKDLPILDSNGISPWYQQLDYLVASFPDHSHVFNVTYIDYMGVAWWRG